MIKANLTKNNKVLIKQNEPLAPDTKFKIGCMGGRIYFEINIKLILLNANFGFGRRGTIGDF